MARPPASAEEREQRIAQLLDATVTLWQANGGGVPSVAEVAHAAGVGKGTVYLYFKSKEDMLLAAHERHMRAFFLALIARAASEEPMDLDTMMALTMKHIVDHPAFLPMATLVAGLKYKGITQEAGDAFDGRMAEVLRIAGPLLYNHFPLADPFDGVRLLMRSYGLILGLWQMLGGDQPLCNHPDVSAMLLPNYAAELDAALRALWSGTFKQESSDA